MPNFCMYIMTQRALFLFLIALAAGCGGGASPAGSSANSATTPTNQSGTNNTYSASESLDFISFWNQTISFKKYLLEFESSELRFFYFLVCVLLPFMIFSMLSSDS